jgi:hypothetical protein
MRPLATEAPGLRMKRPQRASRKRALGSCCRWPGGCTHYGTRDAGTSLHRTDRGRSGPAATVLLSDVQAAPLEGKTPTAPPGAMSRPAGPCCHVPEMDSLVTPGGAGAPAAPLGLEREQRRQPLPHRPPRQHHLRANPRNTSSFPSIANLGGPARICSITQRITRFPDATGPASGPEDTVRGKRRPCVALVVGRREKGQLLQAAGQEGHGGFSLAPPEPARSNG